MFIFLSNRPHLDIKLTNTRKISCFWWCIHRHLIRCDVNGSIIRTLEIPADWCRSEDATINKFRWYCHFVLKTHIITRFEIPGFKVEKNLRWNWFFRFLNHIPWRFRILQVHESFSAFLLQPITCIELEHQTDLLRNQQMHLWMDFIKFLPTISKTICSTSNPSLYKCVSPRKDKGQFEHWLY